MTSLHLNDDPGLRTCLISLLEFKWRIETYNGLNLVLFICCIYFLNVITKPKNLIIEPQI